MKINIRKDKWMRSLVGYLLLMVMIVAVIPAVPSEGNGESRTYTHRMHTLEQAASVNGGLLRPLWGRFC